ncbi:MULTISPECIES: aminotransferase class I/II-fold pyridoxal phosphate-dependent enzyme [unclassified Leptolyngbya]|uniref:pyridoxal phosphate-dependent aminotransferase n=1 Tax=unclassified Leptolyngbya TaxID=2650499 RepID=UPI0016866BC1|nr:MULTISPECIES: aminotransferase class I/II-fold pyridoxal phosphate-dependent enzyme [unclassified Leptolyngbya]MBD1911996.1 aminotransferase class I/II-fold pyridoxal phosphate-dependent enzyme [Leptolyngbya sp. FACHB-8]MBD2155366.1 aminotransferase class I/II-fold pyridoxal phosphate-dependent enzyme [Leptolyngbya sp. FACHB-16]
MAYSQKKKTSAKADQINESVIREMTRVALQHQSVNLAQGFPDFACPPELKQAACDAITQDVNQYAITWGDRLFRQAVADKVQWYLGLTIDPEKEITVTCGSTEAMAATMLALVEPGDEVIVFEPYYENYGPDAILAGATPRYVTLHPPDWTFDEAELRRAFSNRTKAIIVNTPHNPTGKVFSRDELTLIAELCQQWDVLAFTDEIYEHILYDGTEHIAIATLPGMGDRTVTINGLSKTYSVTGWRVGYILAPAELTNAIRKIHDFLTVAAPSPLQRAGVAAMKLPPTYYENLATTYQAKRRFITQLLDDINVPYFQPQGAYYVLADISRFGYTNSVEFTYYLIQEIGVAAIPGSSFFSQPELGRSLIRFCFSKTPETLEAAKEKLLKLKH